LIVVVVTPAASVMSSELTSIVLASGRPPTKVASMVAQSGDVGQTTVNEPLWAMEFPFGPLPVLIDVAVRVF
jgi:hypothetical protein